MEKKVSVTVLIHDGFEETELVAPVDLLKRAGAEVRMISMTGERVLIGAHGISVVADALWEDIACESDTDCVFLPGGGPNSRSLREDPRVTGFVRRKSDEGKTVAAICAAPSVLEKAGLLKGRRATSYPGCLADESACIYTAEPVTADGNVITGRGAGCALEFGLELVKMLFGSGVSGRIAAETMYPHGGDIS